MRPDDRVVDVIGYVDFRIVDVNWRYWDVTCRSTERRASSESDAGVVSETQNGLLRGDVDEYNVWLHQDWRCESLNWRRQQVSSMVFRENRGQDHR